MAELRWRSLFRLLLGALWVLVSRQLALSSSQGLSRLTGPLATPLAFQGLWIFLLLLGFWLLGGLSGGILAAAGLPLRDTRRTEWLRGAAVGWLMALLTLLPVVAVGALHPTFFYTPRYLGLTLIAVLTALLATLALELVFRGFLFAQLIELVGPTTASILLALVYAAFFAFRPYSTRLGTLAAFLFGLLLCLAYLRTHALWLPWGLHAAWQLTLAVVFGLPIAGDASLNTLVASTTDGHRWLTGGAYGPEASWPAVGATLIALWLVYRVSRDYAWLYTHAPIVAAGYAVVIAPPAAHTAMEAAAAPAPLVQILGSTPTAPSTHPAIEDELRR